MGREWRCEALHVTLVRVDETRRIVFVEKTQNGVDQSRCGWMK